MKLKENLWDKKKPKYIFWPNPVTILTIYHTTEGDAQTGVLKLEQPSATQPFHHNVCREMVAHSDHHDIHTNHAKQRKRKLPDFGAEAMPVSN